MTFKKIMLMEKQKVYFVNCVTNPLNFAETFQLQIIYTLPEHFIEMYRRLLGVHLFIATCIFMRFD